MNKYENANFEITHAQKQNQVANLHFNGKTCLLLFSYFTSTQADNSPDDCFLFPNKSPLWIATVPSQHTVPSQQSWLTYIQEELRSHVSIIN